MSNKTVYDVAKMVGGLEKDEVDDIMAQVKLNHQRLDSCQNHDFSIDISPHLPIGKRWRCSNCGGEVDSINKSWYEKGKKHAGK